MVNEEIPDPWTISECNNYDYVFDIHAISQYL